MQTDGNLVIYDAMAGQVWHQALGNIRAAGSSLKTTTTAVINRRDGIPALASVNVL